MVKITEDALRVSSADARVSRLRCGKVYPHSSAARKRPLLINVMSLETLPSNIRYTLARRCSPSCPSS